MNERENNKMKCGCGGGAGINHDLGIDKCLRYHVTEEDEIPKNRRISEYGNYYVWDIGGFQVTEHGVFMQRCYAKHPCGRWSRPKSRDSINSITG